MNTNGLNEFTTRVLLSLVTELADAKEIVQRIETSIVTLAKEHGVKMPKDGKGDMTMLRLFAEQDA